jgi:hypothetical protein
VENKHKLLNPILSRFCEIYVPEYIPGPSDTRSSPKIENLHQYHLKQKFDTSVLESDKQKWFESVFTKEKLAYDHKQLLNISSDIYEKGYSCIDLMHFMNRSSQWSGLEKSNMMLCFHKIKSEFRCEKLLMFYMLDFIYLREDKNIENISFI